MSVGSTGEWWFTRGLSNACLFMDQGFQSPRVICADKSFPNDFCKLNACLTNSLMRRSIRKFNIPPPGNLPGIWTFEDWLVQIPSPPGKKAVQMPHQLVLNYLSSKTNFVFNQHFACLSEKDMPWWHLQTSLKDPFERAIHSQRRNSIL